jgi:hypothetical protein
MHRARGEGGYLGRAFDAKACPSAGRAAAKWDSKTLADISSQLNIRWTLTIGPAVVLTRSTSSEYRMGAGKCSLLS